MNKYNTSGKITDSLNVTGYSYAQTLVAVLKASGDNLTRENVMKQAASLHNLVLPMLLPGITLSTSSDDFAPIKPTRSGLWLVQPGLQYARSKKGQSLAGRVGIMRNARSQLASDIVS